MPHTHVLETHIHNDYVTGGLELFRTVGAEYVVPAGDDVELRSSAGRGWRGHRCRAHPVAGHTHAPSHTPSRQLRLARRRWHRPRSVHWRLDVARHDGTYGPARRRAHRGLDPRAISLGAPHRRRATPTIADERESNPALTDDEQSYVEDLLAGLSAYPAYYAHMGVINKAGPAPVGPSPPAPVEPVELQRRIAAGEWVVDLRSRTAFAAGHLAGTRGFELSALLSSERTVARSPRPEGNSSASASMNCMALR